MLVCSLSQNLHVVVSTFVDHGRSVLKEDALCCDAVTTEVCQWVQTLSLYLLCVGINMCTAGTDVSVGLVSMQKNRQSIRYSFLIWATYIEVIHMCV